MSTIGVGGVDPLRNDEPDVLLEINTTPLIDVMLVLLIMLIITIPIESHSIDMNMPTNGDTLSRETIPPVVVQVAVNADNQIAWNEQVLNRAEFVSHLATAKAQNPQPQLHLHADGKAKYEAVAGVLADIQRSGISQMAFVSDNAP